MSVQTTSNTIEEDSQLNVACDVEAGNPEHLISLYWEFEPKYPGTQTQALPVQRENRELRIENTLYSDAGTYRCTAGNTVGTDTGEIQIVIHCEYRINVRNKIKVLVALCKSIIGELSVSTNVHGLHISAVTYRYNLNVRLAFFKQYNVQYGNGTENILIVVH